MKCLSYNSFFGTFSNHTRMKIIESLLKGSKSVTEICNSTKEEQSKVSHNLRKLMECNFLDVERKGKHKIYSLNKDTITPILNLVEKHVQKYCREVCHKNESLSG